MFTYSKVYLIPVIISLRPSEREGLVAWRRFSGRLYGQVPMDGHPKEKRLNSYERFALLEMWKSGRFTKEDLAKHFGVSVQAIRLRIRKGDVERHRRDSRSLTDEAKKFVLAALEKDDETPLVDVVEALKSAHLPGSVTSVWRYLRSIKWKYKVKFTRPCLTRVMEGQRATWIKPMIRHGWKEGDVAFDEVAKGRFRPKRRRGWSARGDTHYAAQPFRWKCYSLYVYCRWDGEAGYFVQNSRKAKELQDVIKRLKREKTIVAGGRLFLDRASTHKAKKTESLLTGYGVERVLFPSKSPDLNPVEYMNRRLTELLGNRRFKSRDDMIKQIDTAMNVICDDEDNKRHFAQVKKNWLEVRRLKGGNKYRDA